MKRIPLNKKPPVSGKSKPKPGVKTTTKPKIQKAGQKTTPTQALKDSELRYRRLFEAAQDGILILDSETGAIDDVNPYLIDMLGYTREEFLKKKLWEVGAFRDVGASKIEFKVLQEQGFVRYENLPLRAKGGQLIQVEFVSNVYLAGGRNVIQCNIRNITDWFRANEAVHESDKRFRALIENSSDAIALLDAGGRLVYDSPAAPGMLGYTPEDWIGKEIFQLMHPDDLPEMQGLFQKLAGTPGERAAGTFRVRHKSGSWLWIEATATNLLAEPAVKAIVINYRDVTGRKQAETLLLQKNRLYATLARINETIVHVQDRDTLFSEICGIAIEHGEYRMAWIGLVDKTDGQVKPTNFAGEEHGYLADIRIAIKEPTLANGPTGTAILEGQCVICQDIATDPRMEPWREAALQRGYRSSAAVPIREKKNVVGALTVYASDPYSFSEEDRNLLDEIGQDISYALDSLGAEAARKQASRYARSLLEASLDPLVTISIDGKITDVNDAAVKVTGVSREALIGTDFSDYFTEPEKARAGYREVFKRGFVTGYPLTIRGKDSRLIHVLYNASVYRDYQGKVLGVFAAARDITERKKAEEALRDSEEVFRGFLEQSEDAIMLTDEQGVVIEWSKGAEKLTGYSRDESLGRPLWDVQFRSAPDEVKSKELYENIKTSLQAVLTTGHGAILNRLMEIEIERPDGTRLTTQTMGFPIHTHKGFILGSILRDISELKQAEEAAQHSNNLLSEALDIARLAHWEYDVEKDLFLFNDHFYSIFHTTAEREGGYTMSSAQYAQRLVHPDDLPVVGVEIEKALASTERKYRTQLEHRILYSDGGVGYISVVLHIDRDEQGRILRYYGVNQDITQRKLAEEALAKSEREYRTLFENMPIGQYRTSADGRLLDANQAMVEMFGYKDREALLAENVVDFYVDPASDQKFKTEIEKAGVVAGFEAEFKRADGSTFWAEDHNHVIRDEKGEPLFYEGSLIDITARKRSEEAVRQAKDFAENVIQTANVIFIQLDPAGNVQNFNRAAEEITGYSLSEVIGTNWGDKLAPRERYPGIWQEFDRLVINGGTPVAYENPILTKRGEERDILWKNNPLYEGDKIVGVISFGIDITERKRAEEALRKSEQVLRQAESLGHTGSWEQNLVTGKIFNTGENLRLFFGDDPSKGEPFEDYAQAVHPDDREFVLRNHALLLEGGPGDIEFRVVWPDGSVHVLFGRASVVRDESGQAIRVYGTNVDITERKQAEERIRQQLERLAALRNIDRVITSSFDLRSNLTVILDQVAQELGADAADVLLLNSTNLYLEYGAGVGFRTRSVEKANVRLGQNYAGRVALERQLLQIPNVKDQPDDFLNTYLAAEDFACYFGVPLVAKGSVKGVLEVYHRTPLQPDQEWLDFLNTLAGQAALAIDNEQLFENLQRSNIELTLAYDATIEGWSHAMDLRDKETEGHTQRVTEMTMELAGLFGIQDEDLVTIRRGALLHDIGKMGVPDAILLKPDVLTDEEWVLMRKHPTLALDMLSSIRYLKSAIDIPYCHHEKWDGTGYPRGLKGEQIPLAARIFAIVDVWDAVTSDRPYRKAWSNEKAIEYLKSEAGKHFDPETLKVCLEAGVFDRKR